MKHWDTWISNTTSITGETLTYMNIKHYKYNWWNIEIHEYQNTTSITGETLIYMNIKHYKYNWWNIDIHEYQNTTSITDETLIYMNIKTRVLRTVILKLFHDLKADDIFITRHFMAYVYFHDILTVDNTNTEIWVI